MNCPINFPSNNSRSVTTDKVQDEIRGLRFQPIVKLEGRKAIGWEILIWLRNEDPEVWFSSLSIEAYMAIFLWQTQVALRCDGFFWINLPVKVLSDPFCISQICKVSHNQKLILEVQDPENLLKLDFLSYKFFSTGLHALRQYGWKVWLDDVKFDFVEKLTSLNIAVDGVKIDKSEIKKPLQIRNLISKSRELTNHIIVEGIESQESFLCALELDVPLGQGFLWNEKKVPMFAPFRHVPDIRQECKNEKDITYNIYIDCENEYLKSGISYILWELIRNSNNRIARNNVVIVEQEKRANIIFSEMKSGETPVDCSHFKSVHSYYPSKHPVRIVISDYSNVQDILCCPDVMFTLGCKDDISKYIKAINESMSLVKSRQEKSERVNNSIRCHHCLRNKVTTRERDIINLMAEGESLDSITKKYGCTQKVVGAHKRAFMRKVGIKNKVELYSYLYRISDTLKNI